MTDLQVPDVAEPLLGFRGWSVEGLWLTSHGSTPWLPDQPLKASCSKVGRQHPSPDKHCSCGIYAVYDLGRAYGPPLGLVYGWGRVVPATGGFRAEYAKVAGLFGDETDQAMRQLAARYQVPLLPPLTPDLYRADLELLAPPDEPFEEPGLPVERRAPEYDPDDPKEDPLGLDGNGELPAARLDPGLTVEHNGQQYCVAAVEPSKVWRDGGVTVRLELESDDQTISFTVPRGEQFKVVV